MIVTIVRTLNEEANIRRYIESYHSIADYIIVADGGSEDRTVAIAEEYDHVFVFPFTLRKELKNGLWKNPESDHINFLVRRAMELEPTWILHEDADEYPNQQLQKNARRILSETDLDWVYAVRIYTWGEKAHMEHKAQPGREGVWEPSMWGWRADRITPDFYAEQDHGYSWRPGENETDSILRLYPPYCLIHDYKHDRLKKVEWYRKSGVIPRADYPLDERELRMRELPEWAK